MTTPTIGAMAPSFNLPISETQQLALADLKGSQVVLYFYPRDCTPGCTRESQDFRDHHDAFKQLNTVILGISRDSTSSHAKFKAEQGLPFELLADTEGFVCQQYDVIKSKNKYGKTVQGIERSTFLIDAAGILRYEWRNVRVEGHVEQVLEAVRNLSNQG